ncbi:hypothetical protein F2Q69_00004022 [Brassica cretica]|uniref:Exostosin GT47 domain-containing protein n=1 Tax=Brassica cretica TaxID=69181 RepID=A0A8S9PF20_BRACR|nr:hypothetical protein F2Q69_00004022 [Brassica cretica]
MSLTSSIYSDVRFIFYQNHQLLLNGSNLILGSALNGPVLSPSRNFTYGVIEQHRVVRGGEKSDDVTGLKYPRHHHKHEWYVFSDLTRPDTERVASPIVRVFNPAEADLFYVPALSSLSLTVNSGRTGLGYTQERLVAWLEGQEWWRRNNGRDHVIVAECVETGHGSGQERGVLGVTKRNTLFIFMGNRKDGGRVRDLLLKLFENEDDVVIIKHGTQSRENRRAAKQGMHTSKFCLLPAGDTPSACRLFDFIAILCIPVIVSDGIELPFEDVIDYRSFSVFLRSDSALKPGFLVKKLRKVKPGKILKYQKAVKEVTRYFDYTHPNGSVNEIWRQVTQKVPLIKLMINREKRMIKRENQLSRSVLVYAQTKPGSSMVFSSLNLNVCVMNVKSRTTLCIMHYKYLVRSLGTRER